MSSKQKKYSNNAGEAVCTKTLETLPVAIVIFDNSKVYYLNDKAKEILRLNKNHDVKKLKPFAFFVPDYHKRIRINNIKILKGAEFPPVEIKIKDTKGNEIDIEAKSNAVNFNGVKAVQSTFYEIGYRKKLHKELEESQRVLNLLGSNNTDIIFKYDYYPKEGYVFLSGSLLNVLGYGPSDFYEDKNYYKKIIHPDDKKKIPTEKTAYLKNIEKNKSSVIRYLKKDKSIVWLETFYSLVKDPKGKIISLIGISRDISKLKQKEEELNQKWNDYKELLDFSPFAYFIHSKGVCLMCNREAVKILKEKTPEKIIGKYLINYIDAEQRERALVRLKEATEGKEFDFIPYRIIDANGKKINVELKSAPVKYNGENCVLTLMKDLTGKEILEKEKLRAELAEEHNKNLLKEIDLRKKAEQKLIENERQLIEQAAKLNAVFDNSSHLVWTINKKHELTFFNKNFATVFKSKYGVFPKIGLKAQNIIPEHLKQQNREIWTPLYNDALKGKQIIFERQDFDKKNNEIYREVYVNPIKNTRGEIFEVACLAHDITENKKNEKRLIEQASKINAIIESGSHIVWSVNKKGELKSFNKNFYNAIYNLYGVYPQLNKNFFRSDKYAASKEYNRFWNGKYEEVFKGNPLSFVTERTLTSGQKIHRQIYLQPIYGQNNEVIEVSGLGFDITDRVLSEEKATSQSAKLNAIFDGSSHYIWTSDNNNNLTSFNKNYIELIQKIYETTPKIGERLDRGKMLSDAGYVLLMEDHYKKVREGIKQNFELALEDKNKNRVFLEVFLNPIYDYAGHIVEVSGIAHDISEKKINEEKINQSLKEKEVLLKEVHHRVKNNMQVISSILNLQSSYVTDEYALMLLKESQNRIKTMAYIHEALYQNKTFSSINFSEYISTLTNNIVQSYAATGQKIRLVLDVQKIILNLDTSIPTGLIINELVTNCLKHAFKKGEDGIILINLHTKANMVYLEVSDNGKGFPNNVDFKNTNSLGLQLVNTLVEQLGGIIELKKNKYNGAGFYISFSM